MMNDYGGLDLTQGYLIHERHMHMILIHGLLANIMQKYECKHEMAKDIDQIWRYLV